MRGTRFGLVALVVLGALGLFAPAVSANQYSSVYEFAMAAPIILVFINFPINGFMLLLIHRISPKTSRTRPQGSVMNHVLDFGAAVLLFTLIGAVIYWIVAMHFYGPEELGTALVLFIGPMSIGISCIIICFRYLGIGKAVSAVGAVFMTIINLLSWSIVANVDPEGFYYMCIPLMIVAWVLFEVFLVWDATHIVRRLPTLELANENLSVAWDGRPHDVIYRPSMPRMDVRRLRLELLVADLFMLCIVIVMSIVISSTGWPY